MSWSLIYQLFDRKNTNSGFMKDIVNINKLQIANMERLERVAFVNSLSGFKSLNLIASIDGNGNENVAIFNSVVHLGADPALLGFINRPDEVERNTLSNIKETGYYTINHIQESFIDAAHQTSARYPKGVSEFEAVGLTPEYRDAFQVPFVKESSVQISLSLVEVLPITVNNTYLIIGEILDVYLPKSILLEDGSLAIERISTVCGSSLNGYHSPKLIKRKAYAKVK